MPSWSGSENDWHVWVDSVNLPCQRGDSNDRLFQAPIPPFVDVNKCAIRERPECGDSGAVGSA